MTGASVGSLNGAVVALDPKSAANRLSHLWARITRERVFPGGLLAQVRTFQHTKTHLFPSTGLAAVITDFMGADVTFADLTLPFAAMAMDIATARPHVMRDGPLLDRPDRNAGGSVRPANPDDDGQCLRQRAETRKQDCRRFRRR